MREFEHDLRSLTLGHDGDWKFGRVVFVDEIEVEVLREVCQHYLQV